VFYKGWAITAGAQCLQQMHMASGGVKVKGHATVLAGA